MLRSTARPLTRCILLLGLAIAGGTPLAAQGDPHPRLFVSAGRLAEVRRAIAVPGSHHQQAFQAMRARVDRADWRVYLEGSSGGGYAPGGNWNYARSYLAREAAFTYLLTGDRRYAGIAFDALRAVHDDPDPDGRLPESNYGLSRATVGMGFAMAYDWAYHGLSPEQRRYLLDRVRVALDAWPAYRHANLETGHQGSNWVAVSRGGELVMMLATGEEDDRPERFRFLRESLLQHMRTAYGASGWSQEGIGYTSYAGQFLLPAVYAVQSIGDHTLDAELRRIQWHRLLMATHSFTPRQLHLMSGVDGGFSADGQGWTSLVLNAVPPADRPFFRFFYDRHAGLELPLPPGQKFDPHRAGTAWALLYYPEWVPPRDPDGAVPRTLFDEEKGIYLFRNRWQDADDLHVSVMGDFDHHGNAWDIPEALQLGLIGLGTPFLGGPGKEGTGAGADSAGYSTLLVDGRAYRKEGRTGVRGHATAHPDGGGYLRVGGGAKYRALGLRDATRDLRVEFLPGGALLSTLDRVRSDSVRRYTWQLNPGGPRVEGVVRVEAGTESGRPTFTLRGEGGAYLKGWVLTPAGAVVSAGDPLDVEVRAGDAEIWVAMLVGRGKPPIAAIRGRGLGTTLDVAGRVVRWDQETTTIRFTPR